MHTAWSNADKSDNDSFPFDSTMTQALPVWNVPSCWVGNIWRVEIQISNFCFLGSVSTGCNIFLHMLLSKEQLHAGLYSEVVAVLHPSGDLNICWHSAFGRLRIFLQKWTRQNCIFTDTILHWIQAWNFAIKLVTDTVFLQQLHCSD